jgi:hypothetical protein
MITCGTRLGAHAWHWGGGMGGPERAKFQASLIKFIVAYGSLAPLNEVCRNEYHTTQYVNT